MPSPVVEILFPKEVATLITKVPVQDEVFQVWPRLHANNKCFLYRKEILRVYGRTRPLISLHDTCLHLSICQRK